MKNAQKLYRQTLKDIIELCGQKMPSDTKYDKYYLEEELVGSFQN